MRSLGMSIDQLVAHTWSGGPSRGYLTRVDGLSLLEGEVVALVGPGAAALRERLAAQTPACVPIDGAAAARNGTLRVHAMQAARVGMRAVAVSDPLADDLSRAALALAIADLASLQSLGVTAVIDLPDPEAAALVADRVVVVDDGRPDRAYPVLAAHPRGEGDVRQVTDRARLRLAS